tara:strand:+ start:2588 stop:2929 length:342 start_codon:yes stop_codon:yes gene_type:complete
MPSKNLIITQPQQASCGKIIFSCRVNDLIKNYALCHNINLRLKLYFDGDWGDICEDDWASNINTIQSTETGGTIIGAYKLFDGTKIWIMTSGYGNHKLGIDYCYTTVLLPSEY